MRKRRIVAGAWLAYAAYVAVSETYWLHRIMQESSVSFAATGAAFGMPAPLFLVVVASVALLWRPLVGVGLWYAEHRYGRLMVVGGSLLGALRAIPTFYGFARPPLDVGFYGVLVPALADVLLPLFIIGWALRPSSRTVRAIAAGGILLYLFVSVAAHFSPGPLTSPRGLVEPRFLVETALFVGLAYVLAREPAPAPTAPRAAA